MERLDSKKVVTEIDSLATELRGCLRRKKEFKDIHKRVLQLSKIIFTTKKDYKSIDANYPSSVVMVFDKSFANGSEKVQIPSQEQIWEQKLDLGTKILSVLQEAHEIFSLKLKLQ